MEDRQHWNNPAEMPVNTLPLSLHSTGLYVAGNQVGQHGPCELGNWSPAQKRLEGQDQWQRCVTVYLKAFSLLSAVVLQMVRLRETGYHRSLY